MYWTYHSNGKKTFYLLENERFSPETHLSKLKTHLANSILESLTI